MYYLQAFPGDAFEVERADAASFHVIDQTYAKDSTTVFVDGSPLADADPATFVLLGRPDFAKDRSHVFQRDRGSATTPPRSSYSRPTWPRTPARCAGADPVTFRVIRGAYAQDDRGVFYFTDRIAGADAASFEVLDGSFGRDGRRAYWMGGQIPNAEAASFHVLNANFECTADRTHAYYQDKVIAGADPRSFPVGHAATGCSEASISFEL